MVKVYINFVFIVAANNFALIKKLLPSKIYFATQENLPTQAI